MRSSGDLSEALARSLRRQELLHRSSLILNPVENLPFAEDLMPGAGFLHGLYNSDKVRSPEQQRETVHQFAGRRRLAYDSRRVYAAFADALGAADVSMRLLSGLQAHAAFFMAAGKVGQTVLLLPVEGGGHMATKAILERLGFRVVDMPTDDAQHCVDFAATIRLARTERPEFMFIDRSEGLVYEDFSDLIAGTETTSVYDASQYLTNIMTRDYKSPFDMGFRYLLATVHKNFPGPQKALMAARAKDGEWAAILSGISMFVSNMHVHNTYSAGMTLARSDALAAYSTRMLELSRALDEALRSEGLSVVARPRNQPTTHHIWIKGVDRDHAFAMFQALERCRILVNFRLLPYRLGYGLRLGVSAAARLGMRTEDADPLARIIANIVRFGAGPSQRGQAKKFIADLWSRYDAGQ